MGLFGKIRAIELTQSLVEKYGFINYPRKYEDYQNEQQGLRYVGGRLENTVIHELMIFPNAIAIDTKTSTDDSDKILKDLLVFSTSLGSNYTEEIIKRRVYLSQLSFSTENTLGLLNPKLASIGKKNK